MEGFIRVSAAVPPCTVAACDENADVVLSLWKQADEVGSAVVVFPELCLTSYTARDLFFSDALLDGAADALSRLVIESSKLHALALIGLPLATPYGVYNVAAAVQGGRVLAFVPKSYLPNYREFEEKRWFRTGVELPPDATATFRNYADPAHPFVVPLGSNVVMEDAVAAPAGACLAAEICEDMWVQSSPSTRAVGAGATVICNLSASNFVVGKAETRRLLARATSERGLCAYVYVAAGPGESSTDLAFDADAFVVENGSVIAESKRFSRVAQLVTTDIDVGSLAHERRVCNTFYDCASHEERVRSGSTSTIRRVAVNLQWAHPPLKRVLQKHPFIPSDPQTLATRAWETFEIQTNALATRMRAVNCNKLVLGVSGGLDSTHAALVAASALDMLGIPRNQLLCYTMPGLGTSSGTKNNAVSLTKSLGAELRTVSISEVSRMILADMGHPCADGTTSVTELVERIRADPKLGDSSLENVQARLRTLLLMCVANRERGIVVGTGDLSEKALGWCTYSGDHIAMYDVNAGVPKTLIQFMIRWVATERASAWADKGDVDLLRTTLFSILDTPISPELLPTDAGGQVAQLTEGAIGPYELHDFYLFHLVRHGRTPIAILELARTAFGDQYSFDDLKKYLLIFLRRFFQNQFKRSCATDGPKVLPVALSPRGDWRMPSDASVSLWIKQVTAYQPRDLSSK